MLARPELCLKLLAKMGSTPRIHFTEHALRGLAGLSLIGIAAITPYPVALKIIGGFLCLTSIAIVIAPRRWHHSYALYWAARISPLMLRMMAPVPIVVGIYLLTGLVN